jgi:ribonuclease Z
MKIRKIVIPVLVVAALVAAAAYLVRAPLSVAVAKRIVAAHLAADLIAELPDGLHVGLCGAGSPFPDDKRSGPCTLVVAGKRMFGFDSGSGSVRNIGKMGFNVGRIDAIFLTHFHSDHIDGLGELMMQRWVSAGRAAPVPVYGPSGVETVVAGFMQAYALDKGYRVAHHGAATVPPGGFGGVARPFDTGAEGRVVLLKDADLEIAAFLVDHAPVHPAVGYRIAYKGRSVVLSGDTRKSAAVQREAAGVDLLVHEALSAPLMAALEAGAVEAGRANLKKIFADVVDYHSSPEQAAEIARDAKVGYLLLNHIAPPLPFPGLESAFLGRASEIYSGPLRVGIDGDFVSLPAGSSQVMFGRRF